MRFSSHTRLGLMLVLLLVFASGLGLSTSLRGVALAAGPRVWLSQKVGPPTSSVQIYGSGFGPSETVFVDFDTTQVGTAIADATGKFVVRITVPKAALPGTHTVQAIGLGSGLTAQALFLVRTDWAQFRSGPYHTGHNPYENILASSNVSTLIQDWSYNVGNVPYSASVAGGVLYVSAFDNNLYALDALTGALKWNFTAGVLLGDSPSVADGVVYIGSLYDHNLYALDALTGTLKWSFNTGGEIYSSPAIVNGIVYVGSYNGLYALDAVTGALKWTKKASGEIFSSPAVANGVVYVGSGDHKIYALDAATGALKWSYTTGNQIYASSPAVANGVVYVGSLDDKLYALDAVTGTLKWNYITGGAIFSSSPAIADGVVYVGSDDDKLYALDAVTGTLKWSYTTGGVIDSSPAVANGVVYVGSGDDNVYAFHLPGMS